MKAENGEENIITIPDSGYIPDPRGLGWVLFESINKHLDDVAQIDGLTGEKDTYRDFLQRSVRVALALQKRRIKYGDVISICSNMHLETSTPVLSGILLGVAVAGIDECLGAEDAADVIHTVKPKLIFVHPDVVPMIEDALKITSYSVEIVVYGPTDKHTPFLQLLQPDLNEENFKPMPAKALTDTVMIFFTSGSTGLPKPISDNHHSTLYQYNSLIKMNYGWEVTLEYTSPYWTVFYGFFVVSVMLGNTRLVYPKFEKELAWDFARHKATVVFLSTTEILTMCKIGRPQNLSLSHLKYVIVGGNVLSETQLKKIKGLFWEVHILFGYAQSEVSGCLAIFNPATDFDLMATKITSVGRGLPGISYKIVDCKTEKILGANEKGEIRIKPVFPLGLLYQMDSSAFLDNDGWLKTGDLGNYDEDQCFYVVGRIKDMFKFECFRIIPTTIQNVVLSHPAVDEAIVIGIPHEIQGEHPMAVVVLKQHCQDVSAKDIERYVEERVHDSHRLRAGVKIVDDFIRTSTGKVRKHVIRDLIIQGAL